MNRAPHGFPPLRVQLLGPVRIWLGDKEFDLGPMRQRAVLALLALEAGSPVSRESLASALWGDDPPNSYVNVIQVHVTRLRRLLEPGRPPRQPSRLLPAVGDGYALLAEPAAVDALRFRQRLVDAAKARRGKDYAAVRRILRPALDFWQRPLLDVAFHADQRIVTAMEEEHRRAVLWHAEAAIADGRAAEVVASVETIASAWPLDEPAQVLWVSALHAAGHRAEAFSVYRRVRHVLNEELGVEPGPELAEVYQRLLIEAGPAQLPVQSPAQLPVPLSAQPPAPLPVPLSAQPPAPLPAHLPARTGHFTGREAELAVLEKQLRRPSPRMRVVCLEGTAGVGKTSLAVELAHRLIPSFTDGQLFVDLRGHDPHTAAPPEEVLTHLLRSVGGDESRFPAGTAELAAHYRSAVAGRRLLLVLDNAASTDQVLPLLPATPSCAVIVTTRASLAALATHHEAERLLLDVLTAPDALALLARVVGRKRLAAEAHAAGRLAELCGHLPLALRIAAAKLAARPMRTVTQLIEELAEERNRLAALSVEDESHSVRGAFAWSYRALTPVQARTFRLLSVHPGPDFGVDLVASLANHTGAATDRILGKLTDAHLIAEIAPGRFRLHDLIRLFAAEQLTPQESREARQRLFEWYLLIAHGCAKVVNPKHDLVTLPENAPPPPFAAEPAAALDYLALEADNLPKVVREAASHHDEAAWRLAYLLFPFYLARSRPADFVECAACGLRVAERNAEPRAVASMLNVAGVATTLAHRMDEAVTLHRRQLPIWRELGDTGRESGAWCNLGNAYQWQNRHLEALDAYRHGLALTEKAGDTFRAAIILDNIGETARDLGDLLLSEQSLRRALATWQESDNLEGIGFALFGLGRTLFWQGDPEAALRLMTEAHEVHMRAGSHRMAGLTLNWIGKVHLDQGRWTEALSFLGQALAQYREMRDHHGEAGVLATLADVELKRGNVSAAAEHLRRSAGLRAAVPADLEEGLLHAAIAALATRTGDGARAQAHRDLAVEKLTAANCIEARAKLNQLLGGRPG